MGAPEMGQQFGQMPGQAEGLGQQLGQVAGAANMGQQFGQMPMQDKMYRPHNMSPEESGNFFARMGINPQQIQNGFGNSESAPMQNPWAPQMPQPSANQGGQYRLSPGMYGSREQAMQQYNQQMQQMYQPVNGLPQGPRGNLGNIDFSQMVPYGQRRG
jgi:hypothetical protein